MKVIDALKKGKPTLSFEFFPPKTPEKEKHLFEVISQLKAFHPDFVSVTYGALGTTREKTFHWVKEIKQKFKIEPVAHLTCVAATRESIREQIAELEEMGIINILALRGDPPEGTPEFTPAPDGFKLAKDLIAFIKKHHPEFCLGGAGFPEGHRDVPNLELDTQYLKEKIGAGAEYIITQLFFDNAFYFNLVERAKNMGIVVPIVPGVMPITSLNQIKKMTKICGATIPPKLMERIEKAGDDNEAIQEIGVEQAVAQCKELLAAKVPGLHFFVMNQAGPISRILKEIKFGHPR